VRFKKLSLFICKFWEKSIKNFSRLSFLEKIFFYFLCFLEFFYRVGFRVVVFLKKLKRNKSKKFVKNKFFWNDIFPWPDASVPDTFESNGPAIISVGNLTVGGTGKSLLVKKLVKFYRDKNLSCAIFLRGYGRSSKDEKNLILGPDSFDLDVVSAGDEAVMLAKNLSIPVVVGKDRFLSLKLFEKFCDEKSKKIDCIILDDAYQNFDLKKDFEILIFDARAPFGNWHCLPAGPLREKDFSRADVIVLSHADEVDKKSLNEVKDFFLKKFPQDKVFCGKHSVCGIKNYKDEKVFNAKTKKTLALAGIGSFSGFIESLKKYGIDVKKELRYPDHFNYTKKDLKKIISTMHYFGCDQIITTQKDWEKLKKLVGDDKKLFFVLEIEFEFF